MELLEKRIKEEGIVLGHDILKVDSFINHQMDVGFLYALGKEFKRLYEGCDINKILTIESSGIAVAALAALSFNVPMVFAKKSKSSNIGSDLYCTDVTSYTRGNTNRVVVSKKYLTSADKVLILDDFLAEGQSLLGLIDLCRQGGAQVVGCGVLIEKAYQGGGDKVRKIARVEALARIAKMDENGIEFV